MMRMHLSNFTFQYVSLIIMNNFLLLWCRSDITIFQNENFLIIFKGYIILVRGFTEEEI